VRHRPHRRTPVDNTEALQAYATLEPLLWSGELRGPGGRRIARKRLAAITEARKVRFGKAAVKLYRRDTLSKGPIDWKAFVAWCKEHWVALLLAKIVCILLII